MEADVGRIQSRDAVTWTTAPAAFTATEMSIMTMNPAHLIRQPRTFVASSLFFLALLGVDPALSQKEFGGYECTDDCSGHKAGYEWAEARGVSDAAQCPLRGKALSFYEGCLAFTEDPDRGADEDDDGEDID